MKICRIETVFLAIGLTLLAVWWAARIYTATTSKESIARFRARERQTVSDRPALPTGFGGSSVDFKLWSAERIKAYRESPAGKADVPLAILKIPKINLEVPVFNGTDDQELDRGVGRILGTAQLGQVGNLGIAGHRDSFFRGLKEIRLGDLVQLNHLEGIDEYAVSKIQIVHPDDVSVLDPTPAPTLTLVTCFPFYYRGSAPKRFVVTASISNSGQ
jgi:sortase A